MTSQATVAKYLSECRGTVSRGRSLIVTKPVREGLRFVGFRLEVWIGNDAPTFDTTHLAGLVFLLRDEIRYQATMCTGSRRAHWARLWGWSWFSRFTVHLREVGIASRCPLS